VLFDGSSLIKMLCYSNQLYFAVVKELCIC